MLDVAVLQGWQRLAAVVEQQAAGLGTCQMGVLNKAPKHMANIKRKRCLWNSQHPMLEMASEAFKSIASPINFIEVRHGGSAF
jgi:hypothetical protein